MIPPMDAASKLSEALVDNYPPGVTGSEPEICGTGNEDKCVRCMGMVDEDCPIARIPDGEIEVVGEWLCEECASGEFD